MVADITLPSAFILFHLWLHDNVECLCPFVTTTAAGTIEVWLRDETLIRDSCCLFFVAKDLKGADSPSHQLHYLNHNGTQNNYACTVCDLKCTTEMATKRATAASSSLPDADWKVRCKLWHVSSNGKVRGWMLGVANSIILSQMTAAAKLHFFLYACFYSNVDLSSQLRCYA